MLELFSTERLPASDRIDAWQWNAQRICGDCRIQLPKSSFHGSIEIRHVGGLPFTRFSSSPLTFWKEPFDTVNSDKRSCIVITQIAGARRYLQDGLDVLLKPGDSTLIDSARPWSSSCGSDCVRLYLRVPRWMMEDRLQMREIPIARRIGGASAIGASLFHLALSLYDDANWMKEEQVAIALDNYFEILAASVRTEDAPFRPNSELSGRILQFIDAHLAETTLSPVEVASAMGISVRHLHRLFSATGNTLGEYVRSRRLQQCRLDLMHPRFRERTITEIAFYWGFSDAAHFSHSFRKQFGISPRAFRARSATKWRSVGDDQLGRSLFRTEVSSVEDSQPN